MLNDQQLTSQIDQACELLPNEHYYAYNGLEAH